MNKLTASSVALAAGVGLMLHVGFASAAQIVPATETAPAHATQEGGCTGLATNDQCIRPTSDFPEAERPFAHLSVNRARAKEILTEHGITWATFTDPVKGTSDREWYEIDFLSATVGEQVHP
jgi:hypothetical protein